MGLLAAFFAISLMSVSQGSEDHWSYDGTYDGPSSWKDNYTYCGGERQSPIDIHTSDVQVNESLGDFNFTGYDKALGLQLINNGHAARVNLDPNGDAVTIEGAGLQGKYRALQFHFHWGIDDSHGSEHNLDGHAYPLEIHIVHYKEEYDNASAAVEHEDGLAVLSAMFKISQEDNKDLDLVFDKLIAVEFKGENATVDGFPLSRLVPEDTSKYYRYLGSLTTPGCYEAVIWTVFKDELPISNKQLTALRSLWNDKLEANKRHHVSGNYRPVQALNNRTVLASFEKEPFHWSYAEGMSGPLHWEEHFDNCAGQKQSPINIVSQEVTYAADLGNFQFKNWGDKDTVKMILKNNGHALQVDIIEGRQYIHGAGLSGNYKTAQFHFHWGSEDWKGSEHTVNGQSYPMELHIVHYSEQYDSLSDAATKPKGLAVLGIFFHISEEDNPLYAPLLEHIHKAAFKGNNTDIPAIQLTNIVPEMMAYFYRYDGSLTTPGCYQSVIWSVFHETIPISRHQIKMFREIYESEQGATDDNSHGMISEGQKKLSTEKHIADNFRPTQYKYGRKVFTNKKEIQMLCGGTRSSILIYAVLLSTVLYITSIFN